LRIWFNISRATHLPISSSRIGEMNASLARVAGEKASSKLKSTSGMTPSAQSAMGREIARILISHSAMWLDTAILISQTTTKRSHHIDRKRELTP